MATDDDDETPEGECTLPPDHPVPGGSLGRYTLDHDPDEEQGIADYVKGQCNGEETVEHVELIKTEYVMGMRHQVWDVITDKDRWWVVTPPTNLYGQKHFPSVDYTLSFHVGLMMRVQSRESRAGGGEPSPFEEVFRRQDQADERLERAVEPEDFQAVGMQLREGLISLVTALRRRLDIQVTGEMPKDADVKAWLELLVNHLCPGDANEKLRGYLKASCEKTWPLVNWLTHHRHASKTAAIIAYGAVANLNGQFAALVMRERADRVDICPRCASRNIRSHYDIAIPPDGAYYETCGACSWSSHPGYDDDEDESDDGPQTQH
jgi:hypothetical protein